MKVVFKNMRVPIMIVAMTALSANGEGDRSLRGELESPSSGLESPHGEAGDLPTGQDHRSLWEELPVCNCVHKDSNCVKNTENWNCPDYYSNEECKERGQGCFLPYSGSRGWNCGFLWLRKCTGYDSTSDYNQDFWNL